MLIGSGCMGFGFVDISVVICTYNRSESLRKTLESLVATAVSPTLSWEVVVVDNNSSDNTRVLVEDFRREGNLPVKYIFEKVQGLSYARNAGVKGARGDIIAFIDDDVRVDNHWLNELTKAFESFDCACVGGKIIPDWNCEKPSWFVADRSFWLTSPICSLDLGDESLQLKTPPLGANMAFKRSMFEKYGAFRTDLGRVAGRLTTGEDTEFGRRLLRVGETLIYQPTVIVYHAIDKNRLTKGYFQKWYFNNGRSMIRENGIPIGAVCYFGVPRYLFRSLAEDFIRWFVTMQSHRRFLYKLALHRTVGHIVEAFYVSRPASTR
jgi:glucosyl-dolichyl phosphate glucuronosyltransferase